MGKKSDEITEGFEKLAEKLTAVLAPGAAQGTQGNQADPVAKAVADATKPLTDAIEKLNGLFEEDEKTGEAKGKVVKAIGVQQERLDFLQEILVGKDGNGGLLEAVAQMRGQGAVRKSFTGDMGGDRNQDEGADDEADARLVRKTRDLASRGGRTTRANGGVEFTSGLFDNIVHDVKKGRVVKMVAQD